MVRWLVLVAPVKEGVTIVVGCARDALKLNVAVTQKAGRREANYSVKAQFYNDPAPSSSI